MNSTSDQSWLYTKLYLGEADDRADDLLVELGRLASEQSVFEEWFFIRYFDESGFHIRFRVRPASGEKEAAEQAIANIWAGLSSKMTQFLPSQYTPMVEMPKYGNEQSLLDSIPKVLAANYADYEPEHDKYGGALGISIAERLFARSSELACRILQQEGSSIYSRKTMAPLLMSACFTQFKISDPEDYWRQYSQFWLGGDTPAAEDRRDTFFAKGEELMAQGETILEDVSTLPNEAAKVLEDWTSALKEAYVEYQKIKADAEFSNNVLCFNFSHLMLNRLGLTALEESYMAALLEQLASLETVYE